MDYLLLPPEVNSARIYTGPGSAPLREAAAAWAAIAAELSHAATGWSAQIASIPWTGPSAVSMRAAAASHLGWLTATALQTEATAQQARAATAAFETAHAASVHPALVTANRTQLAALVASNLLGQNTPAIAATEAEYAEMWAHDVAAMIAYQTESQTATQLTPFEPPSQVTNPVANTVLQPAAAAPTAASLLQQLADPTTLLGQLNAYTQAFVSSGTPFDIPLQLLSLFTVLWGVSAPGTPLAAAMTRIANTVEMAAAPVTTGARQLTIRAQAGVGQRVGPLCAPPSWGSPPDTGERPQVISEQPARPDQVGIPVPPAIPVTAVGRSNQGRQREDPEYGHVSRIMPTRHPSAG